LVIKRLKVIVVRVISVVLLLQITNLSCNLIHQLDLEYRIFFANHNSTQNSIETDLELADGCYLGEDMPISNECLEDYFLEVTSFDCYNYTTKIPYPSSSDIAESNTRYLKNLSSLFFKLKIPPPKSV